MMSKNAISRPRGLSFATSGKYRLPMYGPLDIRDHKEFLDEAKSYFDERYSTPFKYKLRLENLVPVYEIGIGSFGKVVLVKHKLFKKSYYAMKMMNKSFLRKHKLTDAILNEKNVSQSLNCAFCIRLEYFTQDKRNIYYVLPFMSGGKLHSLLSKNGKFGESSATFYVAQVVLALEYMHYCDILHRDIKPENILIDHYGYLKVSGFGLAKKLDIGTRAYTFCGTPDYIAPEIVLGAPYSTAVDWWAMGVLAYELVTGQTPFYDKNDFNTYTKIVDTEYVMPTEFSSQLKDLVVQLLQPDLTKRLGNLKNGVEDVKKHKWFEDITWSAVLNRRVIPPYVPPSIGNFDTADFPRLKKVSNSSTHDSNIKKAFEEF